MVNTINKVVQKSEKNVKDIIIHLNENNNNK